jgi:HSP20 family protein
MSTLLTVPFSQFGRSSRVPSIFTSLFDDFDPIYSRSTTARPSANITKEENGYLIDLAVPGYERDDINVSVKDGTLTIEAEVKDDSGANYQREFTVSSFKRQWTLPQNTNEEGIEANYKNGVLKLTIPSSKENHRKIDIGVN